MATKIDQKIDLLRAFFERRHPGYDCNLKHWLFLKAAYKGGRAWFPANIFRYVKEGEKEFEKRLERAYRFNHTREAVDLVQKYLFKAKISRNEESAPDVVKEFWKNATLNNLTIDQLMRLTTTDNSIYGRVAIFVDNNMREGAVTIAEAKKKNIRIYAYVVGAPDLLDYAYDEDGDGGLLWVKVREFVRDDADPVYSSGAIEERVRLWTRTEWVLYKEEAVTLKGETTMRVTEIDRATHGLGVVPCVFVDHVIGSDPYRAPGLIDDIAYLDRAAANYLSNLDAIIQDQTFSQLAMPAQGLMPGEDAYDKVLELGTKRIFVYDSGQGSAAKPEFLSPDPKQAGVIMAIVNKLISEIYHTIGLAGERTKEDNAMGIDNSSGVAKAYDFERVNSLLLSKAQSCENAENKIVELICLWAGETVPDTKLVVYPETFDVMRLVDDLSIAETLAKIMAPVEVRREQMRQLVEKMFPRLSKDLKAKIIADIAKWQEGADVVLNPPTGFPGAKSPSAQSRQGQVTKDTPAKSAA